MSTNDKRTVGTTSRKSLWERRGTVPRSLAWCKCTSHSLEGRLSRPNEASGEYATDIRRQWMRVKQ